jgi:antitoxin PrlF
MPMAQSRITAQGQVSVPAPVRKALGVGPGSVLEWEQVGSDIVVRRTGRFGFEDVRRALYGNRTIRRHSDKELKEAIRQYIRKRHPRP